jgi:hypothetical protein
VHEWRDNAECRDVRDPAIFFPDIPSGDVRSFYWNKARQFCDVCTVRVECLMSELPHEEITGRRNGMWGGLTPKERDEYVRVATPLIWRK